MIMGLTIASAQQAIEGKVFDATDKSPLAFAAVLLLDKDSTTVITYLQTDDDGIFNVESKFNNPLYYLKFSYLGYTGKTIKIGNMRPVLGKVEVSLSSNSQNLPSVTVEAKRVPVKIMGDTLSFDAEYYRNNTQVKLTDLIKEIPGVEIINNNIFYKNKRIEKLMIEGRDIYNDQHDQALEGMQSKDIKRIEIIENFKPFGLSLLPPSPESTAINLIMTDEAKNKINGEIGAGYANQDRYEAKSHLYTIAQNWGSTVFVKSNSIGESVMNSTSFAALQGGSGYKFLLDKSKYKELDLDVTEQVNKVKDHALFGTFETDSKTLGTVKLSTMLVNLNRGAKRDFQTEYFFDSTFYKGTQFGDNQSYIGQIAAHSNKMWKEKHQLIIDVPISFLTKSSVVNSTGFFDTTFLSNNNNRRDVQINLSPSINLISKPSKNLRWENFISYDNTPYSEDLALTFAQNNLNIDQRQVLNSNSSQLKSSITQKMNNFFLNGGLSYDRKEASQIISLDQIKNNEGRFTHDKYTFTNSNSYIVGKHMHTISCNLSLNNISYHGHDSKLFPTYSLNTKLRYKPNPLTTYDVTLNIGSRAVEPFYAIGSNFATNEVTSIIQNFQPFRVQHNRGINVLYLKIKIDPQRIINIRGGINQTSNGVQLRTRVNDGRLVISPIEVDNTLSYNSNVSYKTPINSRLNFNSDASYLYSSNNIGSTNLSTSLATFKLRLSSRKLKNLELGGFLNSSLNSNQFNEIANRINTVSFGSDMIMSVKKLRIKGNLTKDLRATPIGNNNFTIIDTEINYQLKRLTLYLKGKDINNITSRVANTTNFSPFAIENQSYLRFPGSVSGGITFLF